MDEQKRQIRIYDLRTRDIVASLFPDSEVLLLRFSPDRRRLAYCEQSLKTYRISVYDFEKQETVASIERSMDRPDTVQDCDWHPTQKGLLAFNDWNRILIWNTLTDEHWELPGH